MPCCVYRVAQLCGDSTTGSWNTSEMYPLTIIGGAMMRKVINKGPLFYLDTKYLKLCDRCPI